MTKSAIVAAFVVLVAVSVVVQAGPVCRYPVNGYRYDITPLQAYPQVIAPLTPEKLAEQFSSAIPQCAAHELEGAVEQLRPDNCGDLPPLRAHCGTSSSSSSPPVSTGEMLSSILIT